MSFFKKSTIGSIGSAVVSIAPAIAPGPAAAALRRLADLAIDGVSFLPGARHAAGRTLENKTGDVEAAIWSLVRSHTALAGAQGFVTNLGGLVTTVIAVPANLAGVAVLQTRLVASIAHLRGYDLDDLRVREAIWMTLLGRRAVEDLVGSGKLPSTPQGVATAPVSDAHLEQQIAEQVLASLLARTSGKQTVAIVGKRIPVIGGGVGLATDSWTTFAVADYARHQFVARRPSQAAGQPHGE
ncbi:EcsC protein family protein [Propionibacterium cyclohexanicum]|uniref:EcsC protein family protein n=1 Tax=Propionibacterium cyclohexanicum TaxID=64702 RepID=A0A1H9SF33_9ACTN|nr:EcsC family protein [Propionibacterium cyclohexanicum]SER83584.1 EcsC protein family protein [Propionibacterium cyclohexanicum]